jgi:putative AbiEi antitoxin of type IV toxin-antitoxin system
MKIDRLATSAKGIVTRDELLGVDVSLAQIRHRREIGALIPVYRGVYRVGHRAPNFETSYMAAVKACGKGALISGMSAAYLFGLIKGKAPGPEVTAPTERRRARYSPAICANDATKWRGIPVTTVPRTLIDLAPRLTEADLARVCHEAGVLHKTTPAAVERLLLPNTSGAGRLRAVLRGDAKVLLSKLEEKFVERLDEYGLPLPETNKPAGGRRVDCRWPDHNLTVELLSYTFHNSRHSWEQDQRRQREAYARGDEFRTYTWDDVFVEPDPMMRELTALLAHAW